MAPDVGLTVETYSVPLLVLFVVMCAVLLAYIVHNQGVESRRTDRRHREWLDRFETLTAVVGTLVRVAAPSKREGSASPPPSTRTANRRLEKSLVPSAPRVATKRPTVRVASAVGPLDAAEVGPEADHRENREQPDETDEDGAKTSVFKTMVSPGQSTPRR